MKSKIPFLVSIILCTIFSCKEVEKETVFHPSHLEQKKNAPFSDAVEANGFLFLAGQIGYDYSKAVLAEGGVQEETKQAIENIETVLKHHNLTLDNVVKCTVILSDIDNFSLFNEVYTQYFTKKPARTTFAASGLARNSNVEIEVIAVK